MREIGTPQWDAKNKRRKLGVQRNGKRKWFSSSIPGKAGVRECEEKARQWLSLDPNAPSGNPIVADAYNQ